MYDGCHVVDDCLNGSLDRILPMFVRGTRLIFDVPLCVVSLSFLRQKGFEVIGPHDLHLVSLVFVVQADSLLACQVSCSVHSSAGEYEYPASTGVRKYKCAGFSCHGHRVDRYVVAADKLPWLVFLSLLFFLFDCLFGGWEKRNFFF